MTKQDWVSLPKAAARLNRSAQYLRRLIRQAEAIRKSSNRKGKQGLQYGVHYRIVNANAKPRYDINVGAIEIFWSIPPEKRS